MQETENIAVVNFVSGINPKSIAALIEVTSESRNRGVDKIILNISSIGGDLAPIFGAYYHLRSLGIPLVSCNMGNIESSAVLLYLAADIRLAAPHSRFLFHNFHWAFGGEPVIHSSLREKIVNLDFDAARYGDIFNERTNGAKSPINISEALKGNAVITSAATALEAGICTAIAEPAVPTGAALWWINAGCVS
jgi:ATP-dependent protease ClpP protease subunit